MKTTYAALRHDYGATSTIASELEQKLEEAKIAEMKIKVGNLESFSYCVIWNLIVRNVFFPSISIPYAFVLYITQYLLPGPLLAYKLGGNYPQS